MSRLAPLLVILAACSGIDNSAASDPDAGVDAAAEVPAGRVTVTSAPGAVVVVHAAGDVPRSAERLDDTGETTVAADDGDAITVVIGADGDAPPHATTIFDVADGDHLWLAPPPPPSDPAVDAQLPDPIDGGTVHLYARAAGAAVDLLAVELVDDAPVAWSAVHGAAPAAPVTMPPLAPIDALQVALHDLPGDIASATVSCDPGIGPGGAFTAAPLRGDVEGSLPWTTRFDDASLTWTLRRADGRAQSGTLALPDPADVSPVLIPWLEGVRTDPHADRAVATWRTSGTGTADAARITLAGDGWRWTLVGPADAPSLVSPTLPEHLANELDARGGIRVESAELVDTAGDYAAFRNLSPEAGVGVTTSSLR
jgi:hypothetical protein